MRVSTSSWTSGPGYRHRTTRTRSPSRAYRTRGSRTRTTSGDVFVVNDLPDVPDGITRGAYPAPPGGHPQQARLHQVLGGVVVAGFADSSSSLPIGLRTTD